MKVDFFDLETATAEDVAETIVTHMFAQGEQCKDAEGSCVYLNEQGLRCAAGVLFASPRCEGVLKKAEGWQWGHLVRTGVAPKAHRELIHSLQQAHDLYTPAEWPKELRLRLVHLGFSPEWCDRLIDSQTQENGNG